MNLSMSGCDDWLPAPDTWPVFTCHRCQTEMRVPFPPSDRLCGECRDVDQRVPEKTLEQRLAEADTPPRFAAWTRDHWQHRHGPWAKNAELRRLTGWPHHHDDASWAVLIAGSGHGQRKAELATAILGEAMTASAPTGPPTRPSKRALQGQWLSQSDWLREIRASWDGRRTDPEQRTDPEHVVWCRAAEAEVLLFEDLGGFGGFQQFDKTWWRLQVTELLHYRERRQLPTIVTVNTADWRAVGRIHESLPARLNVPLKILLEDRANV